MCVFVVFFFFKQKTAYELRISDWSSDVCSSDLITAEQFADVAAQEMHRIPDPDDPLVEVLLNGLVDGLPDGRHAAGPGSYETLIEVGRLDDLPMLTFTSPHGRDAIDHAPPSPAHLAMIADGLRAPHAWADEHTKAHFAALRRAPT